MIERDSRFEITFTALCFWIIIGAYIDSWAHHHGQTESFFSVWHIPLYSGFFATWFYMFLTMFWNGWQWKRSLPQGYWPSFLGCVVFFAGGFGDMVWHSLFGVEASIEALLSPTHLILAIGTGLIVSGPLRASFSRYGYPMGLREWVPALSSATLLLSVLTFMTEYANPLTHIMTMSKEFTSLALGIVGIILYSIFFSSFILVLATRWKLPFGSATFILLINSVLMSFLHGAYQMIIVGFFSGLACDYVYQQLRPSRGKDFEFRLFSFAIPTIFFMFYFAALFATIGVAWSVHAWAGSIVIAGIAGLLSSYAILQPGR